MTAGSGETINVDTVVGTVLIQAGYAELADAPPLASAHQFAASLPPETATLVRDRRKSRK
jgi:hypothetical protein